MTDFAGRFVWYELMTTDTAAAKAFYGKVIGWGSQDASLPDLAYTLFTMEAQPVGGLMTLPEEARRMGAPPGWLGYIAVDDVDAAAAKVAELGGSLHVAPRDIPEVGRFAVVADPQRASFVLFRAANPGPDQPPPGLLGRIGWHELYATDWAQALAFYRALFGWQQAEAIDLGAMGTYQTFSVGGETIGGMFNKPPAIPATFWLFYVNVDDIDAALARVTAAGGQILNGPMQVPGGDWIIQAQDPQGAMFALVGKRAA